MKQNGGADGIFFSNQCEARRRWFSLFCLKSAAPMVRTAPMVYGLNPKMNNNHEIFKALAAVKDIFVNPCGKFQQI